MTCPPDANVLAEQLCQFARENLVAAGVSFSQDSALAEAGIDSFALVEMLLYCERAFGVRVPLASLTRHNLASVATLARCVAELGRNGAASS